MKPKKLILAVAANAALAALGIAGVVVNRLTQTYNMFKYYTEDSNYLAIIASLVFTVFGVAALIRKTAVPAWVYRFRYVATCVLTVTLTVVLFVLAPMAGEGWFQLLFTRRGDLLFHHAVCPIIAIVSLLFLEDTPPLKLGDTFVALSPTVIYGAVLVTLNAFNKVSGPYPFLKVNSQPWYMTIVWLVVILGGAYLITFVYRLILNNKNRVR